VKALYLDSSALIKVVVAEPESPGLRRFLRREGGRRVSSAVLRAEAMRAVRFLGPDARAGIRAALRRVDLVGIDDQILDNAGVLEPAIVRTLDAIHLATALSMGDDLATVVTYDDRMAEGARLLGLPTTGPR
jgi:predicted nucleic acid-binding protein